MSEIITPGLRFRVARNPATLPPLTLPRRYAESHVNAIESPGLKACVRKYGAEFWEVADRGIAPLLVGVAGVGKTYAATVLARAIYDVHHLPVLWCNCAEELVRFDREAFSEQTARRIDELKRTEFVVLDDFTQFKDGRQLDVLTEIVAARYDNQWPTLFTGNVLIKKGDYTALEEAVGAMLARRILEMSEGFRVVATKGVA